MSTIEDGLLVEVQNFIWDIAHMNSESYYELYMDAERQYNNDEVEDNHQQRQAKELLRKLQGR